MSNCNSCYGKISCAVLAVIVGILIGVVAAILHYVEILSVSTVFLQAAFIIAVSYLAVLMLTPSIRAVRLQCCVCRVIQTLLTGILGTVLTAVLLFSFSTIGSVTGSVIVGAFYLFFTLMIGGSACLVKCLANCENGD